MKQNGYKPEISTYNSIFKSLATSGTLETAMIILSELRDFDIRPSYNVYSYLIKLCMRENNSEEACNLFKQMVSEGIAPTVPLYTALITVLGATKHIDLARAYFLEMFNNQNFILDVESFICLMNAYSTVNDNAKLFEIFNLLKETLDISKVGVPAYNIVIHAYCKVGNLRKAFNIFKEMQDMNCIPDKFTICTLIDGCGRFGDLNKSIEILKDWGNHDIGSAPYIAVLSNCSRSKQFDTALSIIDLAIKNNITNMGPVIGNLIIASSNSDLNTSLKFLAKANELNYETNIVVYTSLIYACSKNNIDKAKEIYKLMISKGLKPTIVTYNVMMQICAKTNDEKLANEIIDEIVASNLSFDIITLNNLITLLCNIGKLDDAVNVLQNMKEIYNIEPDIQLYNVVISACAKEKKYKEISKFMEDLNLKGLKPTAFTYNRLIELYCVDNHSDLAMNVYKRMKSENVLPDSFTFKLLIRHFKRVKKSPTLRYLMLEKNAFLNKKK